ncbi:MAG: 16S rRNA (guanine(527)-N(7))-methyltransferase RsmG [Fibromonadaceae bacterium]|jgi:16S rRNA (guanine527-N7)-methyltransferase|nr:16S rRNA (guanine(527)-N(7))-methyltransferase RsmG [Fibromonadaceae bacterium]
MLANFAKEHNLILPENFPSKIQEFCKLLLEANKTTNLVSKNDEQKLLTRHVADSLIFATHPVNAGSRLIVPLHWTDIGSGAGFPVIPLCLYFPQIKFYATESRKKRCDFLKLVKQNLNLMNLEVIQGKAENCGLKNMDFVSCRAVGSLDEDFEKAKKILKKGGHFLTVKSRRLIDEMKARNNKLLKQAKIMDYRLPGEDMEYIFLNFAIGELLL